MGTGTRIALYLLVLLVVALVSYFLKKKLGMAFKIISAVIGFVLTALFVIQLVTDVPAMLYIAGFIRRIVQR